MSRDQRVKDNWAFVYAKHLAEKSRQPLAVVFVLADSFLNAGLRQYDFMLKGLDEVAESCAKLNIPFVVLKGKPEQCIKEFVKKNKVMAIVTDFSPLKIGRKWREQVANTANLPVFEVDAHNVVPAWICSDKLEFGARTFRPKIKKMLPEYLDSYPVIKIHKQKWQKKLKTEKPSSYLIKLKLDESVSKVDWIKPGYKEGMKTVRKFVSIGIKKYDQDRNDPNFDAQSNLSPFLHFGQISSQAVALEINQIQESVNTERFLEELIVRKELSDNFCYYNNDYDKFEGFHDWAKETLNQHRADKREFIYTLREFEKSQTHDELWNSAQLQMVKAGKMHGYMRMYWAKKILEWTVDPESAMKIGIYLNDKYELDGRDPNGYAGIAWSIGGIHDRPWFEREVYGKVRYMNYNGAKRKFSVKDYIKKVSQL